MQSRYGYTNVMNDDCDYMCCKITTNVPLHIDILCQHMSIMSLGPMNVSDTNLVSNVLFLLTCNRNNMTMSVIFNYANAHDVLSTYCNCLVANKTSNDPSTLEHIENVYIDHYGAAYVMDTCIFNVIVQMSDVTSTPYIYKHLSIQCVIILGDVLIEPVYILCLRWFEPLDPMILACCTEGGHLHDTS